MAEWESAPNWTPFEEINGGQQFERKFSADDLNALAENIAYLYERQPTATPIFDGTINIESGNTTISGSYLIDESKAYDALRVFNGVKTYNVKFSAGGSDSGMGDSRDFTSMTFDGDNGFIKYNDKGAFAMNGGFAEYNNNYGDGNGARVQFEEGTECRKEFKELFLSIADEYVEPAEDELPGTWVWNNTLTNFPDQNFTFGSTSGSVGIATSKYYNAIRTVRGIVVSSTAAIAYYHTDGSMNWCYDGGWEDTSAKTITFNENAKNAQNYEIFRAFVNANATKQ